MGGCSHNPSHAWALQRPAEAGRGSPRSLHRGRGPANSFSSDSGLQNCEGQHFYGLKPPSVWRFVRAALGDAYSSLICKMTRKFSGMLPARRVSKFNLSAKRGVPGLVKRCALSPAPLPH